ncbi:hypothetical protein HYH03_018797, partial [Edaphochlamys debaryana]
VGRRTGSLVAAWQAVGWCHGVLNTDNMSVTGLTIDYGPFGFLDRYDPDFISNGSDDSGRYDFKGQPEICRWNCEKLAEAVRAVLPEARGKRAITDAYDIAFRRTYRSIMRRKLGLATIAPAAASATSDSAAAAASAAAEEDGEEAAGDEALAQSLLGVLEETGADFTNTFRCLSRFPVPPPGTDPASPEALGAGGVLDHILGQLADAPTLAAAAAPRIPPPNLTMLAGLAQKNPDLLHQLGMSQQMLASELARLRRHEALLKVTPADKAEGDRARWSAWLAQYGARLQERVAAGRLDPEERVRVMNATNPRFILRNWIAQAAIERAEEGDFSEVARVYALLRNPFSEASVEDLLAEALAEAAAAEAGSGGAVKDEGASSSAAAPAAPGEAAAAEAATGASCVLPMYDGRPPEWAAKLCVTCSS